MRPDPFPILLAPPFSPEDLKRLRSRGISPLDAARQARLFLRPPSPPRVLRPCSIGDGIEKLSPVRRRRLVRLTHQAGRKGRLSRFVPASGAASRLFTFLRAPSASASRFFSRLSHFALHHPLREALSARRLNLTRLSRSGTYGPIVEALFDSKGLDLSRRPKALMPFHQRGRRRLTAFEEQWAEAAAGGMSRMHVTVDQNFLSEFKRLRRSLTTGPRPRCSRAVRVEFSVQDPGTDTLAQEKGQGWARDADGRLLFRPGGHGALLENLERMGGDIVFIKNIDNVPQRPRQAEGNHWRNALAGRLIEVQTEAAKWIRSLQRHPSERDLSDAESFVSRTLGIKNPRGSRSARAARALRILSRPWRVCGVVPNAGEPGGGPFWVKGNSGPSRQILEGSQLGTSFLRRASHFNPVDMVVGLRDGRGIPFRLERFSDPTQVILSTKFHEGRELRTLEHPGLWNGGMAHWNTLFVEIPGRVFHPVKTVMDLLRPGHRAVDKVK